MSKNPHPARTRRPARTKSRRKLTRGRMLLYRVAVWIAHMLLETLWHTARLKIVGEERLTALVKKHGAIVPALWHQHLLLGARFLVSNRNCGLKPGFMISPSVDGQAPTMLAISYGAHVVRGSGSYTGLRAVRGAQQAIEEGISPAITPDGPRGPRFVFKPGAIFAAQITGRPVVPVAYAARPARVLNSWDKFVIPWPFAKICVAIGEPFYPPADGDDAAMESMQREMERRMHDTYRQARAGLDA